MFLYLDKREPCDHRHLWEPSCEFCWQLQTVCHLPSEDAEGPGWEVCCKFYLLPQVDVS